MYDEEDSAEQSGFLLCVKLPDLRSQIRVVVQRNDSVFSAKQAVLSKLMNPQDLPNDPLNYGLYLRPSGPGRPGKFLDDGRLLSEYEMSTKSDIEFLFKRRDYTLCPNLTNKQILKANSNSNQKKLIDHVLHGSVKKIEKLMDKGLDPNFIHDDGNTPLGIACGRNGRVECIPPLLSRGAHIDFRGNGGLTPIHRAAIGGNAKAVKNLLSLGSSANYTDEKGLTPLYHASIMGDDVGVCEALLKHKAIIGLTDQIGWTELHQVAKHGNYHLIDIMLLYGADIDAQNDTGNTPLHVAAQHGQLNVATHLMKRGANRDICNASGQPPNQVAILCGHRALAKEVLNFTDKEPLKGQPATKKPASQPSAVPSTEPLNSYSSKTLPSKGRKSSRSELPFEKQKWSHLDSAATLTRHYSPDDMFTSSQGDDDDDVEEIEPVHLSTGSSSGSGSNTPQSRRYSNNRKRITAMTTPTASTTSPASNNTRKLSPAPPPPFRERLYVCTPGKRYTVTQDIVPQQPGDLTLVKGQEIEVLYIGKGNFWEGKVDGKQGWFPQSAIKPPLDKPVTSTTSAVMDTITSSSSKKSMDKTVTSPPSAVANTTTTTNSSSKKSSLKQSNGEKETRSRKISSEEEKTAPESLTRPKAELANLKMKDIVIKRISSGYGFAMRGIRTVNIETFKPNEDVPALQYVGEVDKGGAADKAGLEQGDFITEVNGVDTTYATHHDVVDIIKKAGGTLKMKIVVPKTKPKPKTAAVSNDSTKLKSTSAEHKSQSQSTNEYGDESETQKTNKVPPKNGAKETERIDQSQPNSTPGEQTKASDKNGKTSPKPTAAVSNSSRKGGKLADSPSPLLHSIRYEDPKQKQPNASGSQSNSPSAHRDNWTKDTERKKENEEFEKQLQEESDENELSGFAKELREASLKHFRRISADEDKIMAAAQQEMKQEQKGSVSESGESKSIQKTEESKKKREQKKDIKPTKTNATSNDSKSSITKDEPVPSEHHTNHAMSDNVSGSRLLQQVLPRRRTVNTEEPSIQPLPSPTLATNTASYGDDLEDDDDEDGWTEMPVETSIKDFNKVPKNSLNTSQNRYSPIHTKKTETGNQSSAKTAALNKTRNTKGKTTDPRDKPGSVSSPSGRKTSNDTFSKSPTNSSFDKHSNSPKISQLKKPFSNTPPSAEVRSFESKEKETKNSLSMTLNQKSKAPPPPVAKKPKILPAQKSFQQREEEEESVLSTASLPVTSLRDKFETMTATNTGTSSSNKPSSYKKPVSPISKKKTDVRSDQEPKQPPKSTTLAPSKPSQRPPADIQDTANLPPPLSMSDDEEEVDVPENFPIPSILPPALGENSDSDEGELEDVPPPPPLYDDMDDADLFEDDPMIQDVPVPLNELVDEEAFKPTPSADHGSKDRTDMLDNIVGQLQTFVTTTSTGGSRSTSVDSEGSDEVPPPLPSSPPPLIPDSSDQFDEIPPIITQSFPVNKPHPPTSNDLTPPPIIGLPPPDDFPPSDDLPFIPDVAPPPIPEDLDHVDLPPPQLPPPFFDEEDTDLDFVLPPPEALPLPPDSLPLPPDILPPPPDSLPPPPDDLPPPLNSVPPPPDDVPPPPDDLPPPPDDLPPPPDSLPPPPDDLPPPPDDLPPPPNDLPPPSVEGHNLTHDMSTLLPPSIYEDEEDDVMNEPPPLDLPPPPPPPISDDEESLPPPQSIVTDEDSDGKSNASVGKSKLPNLEDEQIITKGEDIEPSPVESFDTKPLDLWAIDDVCQWLEDVGLDPYISTFRENEIVGEHLRDLTREDLKDLGISKVGHIKTFKQKLEPYLSA